MRLKPQRQIMRLLSTSVVLLLGMSTFHSSSLEAASKPNVIFILCDDLGWGDLGVLHQNGSKHDKKFSTPHLDAMARDGVQLRNHYCPAPVCAPSRASLLLGVHQGHCEIRDNQFDKELPNNHTLATVMRSAGYSTAIIGKYGLQGEERGASKDTPGDIAKWASYPTQRGFDEFFGSVRHVDGHLHYPAHDWPLGNATSHQTPKELWHNENEISSKLEKCYTTDLFTAYAKHWIAKQAGEQSKPFFVYLAYDTPHAALQVPTCPYPEGRGIEGGVQWIGEDGKMINTATGEIDSYRYEEHTGKGWTDVEERFATMVRRIDDCVGDLLQTLKDLGVDDNTLVVLSSDNGPHCESYLAKANYKPTSFQSYGPFDGIKRDTWEGGIRVPTLAWWPSKIPAGTIDTSPSQFHDWMATFAEVAGTHPPAVCDGVTLLPTITKSGGRDASTVYVEYQNGSKTPAYDDFEPRKRGQPRKQMQVIMHGDFKGIRTHVKNHSTPFQIYDLHKDPSELNDLASTSVSMKALQKKMQTQVLRLRRANKSAPRPYDGVAIPSLKKQATQPGILVASASGAFQYVPAFNSISSEFSNLRIARDPQEYLASIGKDQVADVYRFKGCINVPSTAQVRFQFQSNAPALVRIHEAVLFDNDFNHDPTSTLATQLKLEQGNHPIEVTILGQTQVPAWKLNGATAEHSDAELVQGKWHTPVGP